jgi:4-diphosphocytidyl-2-C-methyl-D-erythritol kinase
VPAKVNLHLSVGPRRRDGFHELQTVFQAVDLVDEIVATHAERLSLKMTGEGAESLPVDDRNLAWRAAARLSEVTGRPAGVHLDVHKRIPVAGGMAGGSADAAGALVACARLWGVDADLPALAAELGSDVAFPLLGGTALGTGRGEVLRPVGPGAPLHWVFAVAGFGISAGDAYAELDRQRAAGSAPEPAAPPGALIAALATGDAGRIADELANDLQAAALALAPQLLDTLDAGTAAGARAALVSGSGPTCAFLCDDAAGARSVAARLREAGHRVHVASGPVPGARVAG